METAFTALTTASLAPLLERLYEEADAESPATSPAVTELMVFPCGISVRVAICGKEWNQNCSFFVVNLPTKFPCVLIIVCLSMGM